MDRFIGLKTPISSGFQKRLKSNMDRFIGIGSLVCDDGTILFKIQYG